MPGTIPERRLRVLITNHGLRERGGSELYVRDIAEELLFRGHFPVLFSPLDGAIGAEIRQLGIPVITDLERLADPPDLIHAQHHLPAAAAMLRFPAVPAVMVCHGWRPWLERPLLFPQIHRYIAVDEACRERLIAECGIPAERISIVLNFANIRRFGRVAALPELPKRALLFSNYEGIDGATAVIREACVRCGIDLDVAGMNSGQVIERPEELLSEYDLVFAKGRSAIEALASGCAVIPCGFGHFGPLVTAENLEFYRLRNFGLTVLREPVQCEKLLAEIVRFNRAECERVTGAIRRTATLDQAADELLEIYHAAIAERAHQPDGRLLRAAAEYLAWISPEVLRIAELQERATASELEKRLFKSREAEYRSEFDRLTALIPRQPDVPVVQSSADEEISRLRTENGRLRQILAEIEGSPTIRTRNAILNVAVFRGLHAFLRRLARGKRSVAADGFDAP